MGLRLMQFVLETLTSFFVFCLAARFLLQWFGVSLRNPLGQFLTVVSDWIVRPLRRVLPALGRADTATLVAALATEGLRFYGLAFLYGHLSAPGTVSTLAVLTVLATLKVMVQVLLLSVLLAALFSWVNPYAPAAALFNALAEPLLRPFRRLIPPVGGVDLSPLAALLLLQVLSMVLSEADAWLVPLLHF